ncbi:amino acid transporter [Aureimonas fodinaquatilis]|uniref:Amino acid transporter n=1 Tax=Aureimonas fodinaquatilis TaxID=2565783 RepID=A0A5B0DX40_9HYPH|nr:LysE/ArgO family amino acid transporter [Aureimonas fodinaquatilis]KAA0970928.1 amino acid transporter [Aureimonas fodinaquatilis]
MIAAYTSGLFLGFSLIVAIGAQNAFVLQQGLRGHHVFAVCLTCAISDALLIAAGVSGFGLISTRAPWLEPVMRYAGAAFLFAYALRNIIAVVQGQGSLKPADQPADQPAASLAATLAICLMLTWANPHVYLDTVVLLGSISTQYTGYEKGFALGAMTASFLFFFSLGYGARFLRPLFARPIAWRVLDVLIAAVMVAIGISLLV